MQLEIVAEGFSFLSLKGWYYYRKFTNWKTKSWRDDIKIISPLRDFVNRKCFKL
jgi:hypothetical protein